MNHGISWPSAKARKVLTNLDPVSCFQSVKVSFLATICCKYAKFCRIVSGVLFYLSSEGQLLKRLYMSYKMLFVMHKLLATLMGLFKGQASIVSVEKILISKPPGDVTDLMHN